MHKHIKRLTCTDETSISRRMTWGGGGEAGRRMGDNYRNKSKLLLEKLFIKTSLIVIIMYTQEYCQHHSKVYSSLPLKNNSVFRILSVAYQKSSHPPPPYFYPIRYRLWIRPCTYSNLTVHVTYYRSDFTIGGGGGRCLHHYLRDPDMVLLREIRNIL